MSSTHYGKINLAALPSHRIISVPVAGSKTEKIECILLPLGKNGLYKSEKGNVYLDIVAFELKSPTKDKDGAVTQTHLVKRSISKDERKSMSEEDQKNQPIIGSLLINDYTGPVEREAVQDDTIAPSEDDLPF